MRRNISSNARGKQIRGRHNCEMSLKDSNGVFVGKGILLSEIQTRTMLQGSFFFHIKLQFVL